MPYPYTAIIERKSRTIMGMDADGKYCLNGNEKLEITPLEPETFRALTLREVAKLTFTGGWWLLDGEGYSGRWFDRFEEAGGEAGRMDSAARTDMKTVGWLHEKLTGLPPEDRTKIKGVAWFVERVQEVAGRPSEARKKTTVQIDGTRCESESGNDAVLPAKTFEPILLTDFGIIAGNGEHPKSYEALIEGEKRRLNSNCFDPEGNLVLADGQRYIFERLNFNPPGQPPDEPAGDIFGWPLLEAVKLQQWQGDWKWNDEPLPLRKWMESELQKLFTKRGIPQQHRTDPAQIKALLRSKADELHSSYATRAFLHSRLQHLPPAVQALINGVAWFKHDDGADGWNTPILLKSFRPLPSSAKPDEVAHAAAHHLKSAADDVVKQIRSVNSEVRASVEQLAEVAQPFREMYKDLRLAGAKAEALKAGIPELVVDSIVRFHHTSKLPTTDGLMKYLNDSGFATKLESTGHGTSRATVGRWLAAFKKIMRRRGIIQVTRLRIDGGMSEPSDHSTDAADQSGLTSPDTSNQELPEDSDDDEQ